MDPVVWQQSIRTSLFYRINLNHILYILIGNLLLFTLAPFGKSFFADSNVVFTFCSVLAISFLAFAVADIFIGTMKNKLCNTGGLFGKDLNKLGDQATKEKV